MKKKTKSKKYSIITFIGCSIFCMLLSGCSAKRLDKSVQVDEFTEVIECRVEGKTLYFEGKGRLTAEVVKELTANVTTQIIDEIVIEDGITAIGKLAFVNWTNLEGVKIAGSVKIIENDAFLFCFKLKWVDFSEGLLYIGHCAFSENVIGGAWLPKSIEGIGANNFDAETSLYIDGEKIDGELLVVNGSLLELSGKVKPEDDVENVIYAMKAAFSDEWLALHRDENGLVVYNGILLDASKSKGKVVVPSGVKCIGYQAFARCNEVTSVVIPEGVEMIDVSAFAGCKNLLRISLPQTLKFVGEYAFSNCESLETIELSAGVKCIYENTFKDCKSLKSIVIPNSVMYIDEAAFYGCSSLNKVETSEELVAIGKQAFYDCVSLQEMDFTKSKKLKRIGEEAFENDNELTIYCSEETLAEQYAIANGIAYSVK